MYYIYCSIIRNLLAFFESWDRQASQQLRGCELEGQTNGAEAPPVVISRADSNAMPYR